MMFDPKKDFADVRYPQVFQTKNILDKVKELAHWKEALSESDGRSDIDNLIRYVVACYDKGSPIVRVISNIGTRKMEAALVAGYDLEKDSEVLDDIFAFEGETMTLGILLLKEQNDMYWAMTVSNEQCFWEYQKALNTSITNYKDDKQKMDALNVKSKIMDECDKITERVEAYRLKIFGDPEIVAKVSKKNFSPESIAHRKNV